MSQAESLVLIYWQTYPTIVSIWWHLVLRVGSLMRCTSCSGWCLENYKLEALEIGFPITYFQRTLYGTIWGGTVWEPLYLRFKCVLFNWCPTRNSLCQRSQANSRALAGHVTAYGRGLSMSCNWARLPYTRLKFFLEPHTGHSMHCADCLSLHGLLIQSHGAKCTQTRRETTGGIEVCN